MIGPFRHNVGQWPEYSTPLGVQQRDHPLRHQVGTALRSTSSESLSVLVVKQGHSEGGLFLPIESNQHVSRIIRVGAAES